MDPNEQESHNIGFIGFFKIVLIIFIVIVAILGILIAIDIMSLETFKDYAIKLGIVAAIIVGAGGLISLFNRSN